MKTQNDDPSPIIRRMILVGSMTSLALQGLVLLARMAQQEPPKKNTRKKKQPATPNPNSTRPPLPANPQPPAQTQLPEQQLGDTPVAPWEMPTPEEKAKVQPAREALEQAVAQVDSPAKAAEVANQLLSRAGDRGEEEIIQAGAIRGADPAADPLVESAQAVQQAAATAAPAEKVASVIAQTAELITATDGRDREALAEAVQEVLNPEQQGAPAHIHNRNREYLRRALIKRMRPLDALDAETFLAINHLPHNRWLNGFFYFVTLIFKGGAAWFGLIGLNMFFDRRNGWRLARRVVLPLVVSTAVTEFPIKRFFHRRRPFIGIIQAIVIGRKPGTWSFPSGHSAASFAGALLLGSYFPRLRWLFFSVAGLVGFSRIYLGDHYPGDVLSGALSGMALAEVIRRLQQILGRQAAGR